MACTDTCQRPTPTQAHCGACHRTFGAVSGFDRHRRAGECLDPAALGMAEGGRIWRMPRRYEGAFPRVPVTVDGRTGRGGTSV